MRKLMLIFMLGMFFAFPFSVSAQSDTTLSFVTVQMWPEYDDPSMLVIVDFQTAANTTLPDYARIARWTRGRAAFDASTGLATANGRPQRPAIASPPRTQESSRTMARPTIEPT